MESKVEQRAERSKIVIDKMKFEVVNICPKYISEKSKKEIEHSLYCVFRKYA